MEIMIADDHAMVRRGLGVLLAKLFGDVTVTEASDVQSALNLLGEGSNPDIILLDLMMPGMDGQRGLRRVIERVPHIPVALISASEEQNDIAAAIRNGARGFILKASDGTVLKLAISLMLSGEIYIPSRFLTMGEESPLHGRTRNVEAAQPSDALSRLTARESSVLRLLMQGLSNKEIARHLDILEGSVKKSVWRLFRKLGVSNRTQAVILANRLGWFGEAAEFAPDEGTWKA